MTNLHPKKSNFQSVIRICPKQHKTNIIDNMSNRAAKYEQLHKSLKKHFKPQTEPGERSVLEHLIYACCLEDARTEQADEAFAKLQQAYFDWNEVRVTTVIELGEALSSLPNASQAGHRIKRCLQSLFETRYDYNIDDMKKANLSKATDELTALKGVTPFVLNYVSQNGLGGHAIPVDTLALDVMVQCEIITTAEAEKRSLPGVERAIPKNKGFEFGSLLHQFAVEFQQNPKNAEVLAVFKDMGVSPKAKEVEKAAPKKETKKAEAPASAPVKAKADAESAKSEAGTSAKKVEKPALAAKESAGKSEAAKAVDSKKKVEAKVEDAKKPEPKKAEAGKPEVKKPEAKKTDVKKPEAKTPSSKVDSKPAAKKTDAKPAPKAADKKETPAKAPKPSPASKKSAPVKKPVESKGTPTKKKPR
jgi:endonuclease III